MAATWNNNVCLVEGRGSFGTRLVQEPGAARYVYTRVHNNFEKYVKDMDLSPVHDDPEHEPPSYYLPVIPLVLANGTKGIATGFATNILPRSPNDLSRAVREYLLNGNIAKRLPVSFPEFNGSVTYDIENKRFIVNGTFERNSKTVLTITEVPYGYDRESYVKVLNRLEDDNDIVSYEDKCDKQGFKFEIKLKLASANAWTDERIVRKFKLTKPLSENLTVIDENGRLREYEDERDLIKDFCEFRIGVLQKRIELRLIEAAEEIRWLKVKMEFIQAILNDKIIFKDRKKKDVGNQILENTSATNDDIDRLLRINIMSLTNEMVRDLSKDIVKAEKDVRYWTATTPKKQFMLDLEEIE